MSQKAEEFLSVYRIIESALTERFGDDGKRGSSVVIQYLSDVESLPVRATLNTCREIRNLLTHSADENGEFLVEPSQSALDALKSVRDYILSPKPALTYAAKGDSLFTVHANDNAMNCMKAMAKRGFSHVPVVSNRRVTGVFSVVTVFSYALEGGFVDEETRIGDFGRLLDPESHITGRFATLREDALIEEAAALFDEKGEQNSRLSAVFLTSDGTFSGTLTGMLTPWDIIKHAKD